MARPLPIECRPRNAGDHGERVDCPGFLTLVLTPTTKTQGAALEGTVPFLNTVVPPSLAFAKRYQRCRPAGQWRHEFAELRQVGVPRGQGGE